MFFTNLLEFEFKDDGGNIRICLLSGNHVLRIVNVFSGLNNADLAMISSKS